MLTKTPKQDGLRVLAAPAWINRNDNPLNYLLSQAEQAQGARVIEWGLKTSVLSSADIVHVHWPENWLGGNILVGSARATGLLTRLAYLKLRGARIVWTVHNVQAHSPKLRNREWPFRNLFIALVDAVIFLSESSRDAALAERPKLALKPSVVVPLGGNSAAYPPALKRAEARARFNLGQDDVVIGFIGDIKPYKGLDEIIDAMAERDFGATLFIAGQCREPEYRKKLVEGINRLKNMGRPVIDLDRRLSDQELVDAISASDVVALPYRQIWNSSAAILLIERGARLLTSDLPLFRELQDELGPEWIDIVEQFSPDAIEHALQRPEPDASSLARHDAFVRRRDWNEIARHTLAFFKEIKG